jgi:hypothetical protein
LGGRRSAKRLTLLRLDHVGGEYWVILQDGAIRRSDEAAVVGERVTEPYLSEETR